MLDYRVLMLGRPQDPGGFPLRRSWARHSRDFTATSATAGHLRHHRPRWAGRSGPSDCTFGRSFKDELPWRILWVPGMLLVCDITTHDQGLLCVR